MHQHRFTRTEVRARKQRVVSGNENFRHGCRAGPIKIRRNLGEMILGYDNEFRLGAAPSEAEDSLSPFPQANLSPNFFHFPSEFQTGNVLAVAGRGRIVPLPLQNIGAVESCGTYAYADAV